MQGPHGEHTPVNQYAASSNVPTSGAPGLRPCARPCAVLPPASGRASGFLPGNSPVPWATEGMATRGCP